MKFEYQPFDGMFLPLIPIHLFGKDGWVEIRAFIDTGATYCLFNQAVAEILGINLESGEIREIMLGDGDIIKVHLHSLSVKVAEKGFSATIGFSKDLGTGFSIIGRKDIFEHFLVSFNEREKWTEFKPLLD